MKYNQVLFSIPVWIAERRTFDDEEAQNSLDDLACSIVGHKIRRYDWDGDPIAVWITCRRCGLDFGEAPEFADKLVILTKEHMIPAIVDYVNRPSPLLTFLKKRD